MSEFGVPEEQAPEIVPVDVPEIESDGSSSEASEEEFLDFLDDQMHCENSVEALHWFRSSQQARLNHMTDLLADDTDSLKELAVAHATMVASFSECVRTMIEDEEDSAEHVRIVTAMFIDVERNEELVIKNGYGEDNYEPYDVDNLMNQITEIYEKCGDDKEMFRKIVTIKFKREFTDELKLLIDLLDF